MQDETWFFHATCKGLFYGAIGQPKNFEVNRLLYEKTPAFSLPLTEAYALIMNRRYKGKKDRDLQLTFSHSEAFLGNGKIVI